MKISKENIKQYILFTIGILLIPVISIFLFQNFKSQEIYKLKPENIVVANISTQTAEIYWKSQSLTSPIFSYKKTTDSGLYKDTNDLDIFFDNISQEQLYVVHVEGLEPNTEYSYKIQTDDKTWDTYTFKTLDYASEVSIPNIITGSSVAETFVLISDGDTKYMLDTQYHGTWALDLNSTTYTTENYANYKTEEEIQKTLSEYIFSPVYASYGANCYVGLTMYSQPYLPDKATVTRITGGWVSGCAGSYASACYEDVYCRSMAAGVDPAFAFTIWTNESGGSNYAHSPSVADFGLESGGVPRANFNAQINYFLRMIQNSENYISGCSTNVSELVRWGAKYWRGDCTSASALADGQTYITHLSTIYSWLTNMRLSWPLTISPEQNACSSSTEINRTYNSCTESGLAGDQTAPDTGDSDSGTDTGTNSNATNNERQNIVVTNTNQYCTDEDGCTCTYQNSDGETEHTVNAANGYTCPAVYTGRTTITSQVCCRNTDGVSIEWPYECNGSVVTDTPITSCSAQDTTMDIQTGVNFIQALDIVNTNDIDISTAKKLISYSSNKIIAVGLFRNDHWEKIVKVENDIVNGEDFNLEAGESYLVISTEPISIPVTVYPSQKDISLEELTGWNLIPASIFNSNSLNSTGILQNTSYGYIKQVAVWNDSTSVFDYTLRDLDGTVYGERISIPNTTGFFVKITE